MRPKVPYSFKCCAFPRWKSVNRNRVGGVPDVCEEFHGERDSLARWTPFRIYGASEASVPACLYRLIVSPQNLQGPNGETNRIYLNSSKATLQYTLSARDEQFRRLSKKRVESACCLCPSVILWLAKDPQSTGSLVRKLTSISNRS